VTTRESRVNGVTSPIMRRLAAPLLALTLFGCGSDSPQSTFPVPTPDVLQRLWQNPFLSPNPTSNIHNDSYLSDTYAFAGPTSSGTPTVDQVNEITFRDPETGDMRTMVLGECAGQAFDAQGNIQTVAAGVPNPLTKEARREIVTLDRNTLQVLAFHSVVKPFTDLQTALSDFGGAGYFYQDNQFRMVVAMPDNHIQVLARQDSAVSDVDRYVPERDIDVAAAVGRSDFGLYALMPDGNGNIWFTSGEGVVGFVTPQDEVRWFVLPAGERIANSHSVDQDGGVYILSTHALYRFQVNAQGQPEPSWRAPYDRGTGIKPGQVSFGSGTSPTLFEMAGRRFVAIADNDPLMHVNVYRTAPQLGLGEERLFAQVSPFGNRTEVSDENSLIVAPSPSGAGVDIYAENNWGYEGLQSTVGSLVTEPGFARLRLTPEGGFSVDSVNDAIRVPTVVSKMSIPSRTVYTYEKRAEGWFLTGLDSQDLNRTRFSVQTGPGQTRFNNHYSALSLDPDGRTIYVGTALGLTRVRP
jgi:hypothetical protein